MKKAILIVTSLSLVMAANLAIAQKDDADAATAGPKKCPNIQASTVFVADKTGSRHKGTAEKISKTHKTAESQGWDFDDLEIYIENGDLQGFFITYTREHPCNNR